MTRTTASRPRDGSNQADSMSTATYPRRRHASRDAPVSMLSSVIIGAPDASKPSSRAAQRKRSWSPLSHSTELPSSRLTLAGTTTVPTRRSSASDPARPQTTAVDPSAMVGVRAPMPQRTTGMTWERFRRAAQASRRVAATTVSSGVAAGAVPGDGLAKALINRTWLVTELPLCREWVGIHEAPSQARPFQRHELRLPQQARP